MQALEAERGLGLADAYAQLGPELELAVAVEDLQGAAGELGHDFVRDAPEERARDDRAHAAEREPVGDLVVVVAGEEGEIGL